MSKRSAYLRTALLGVVVALVIGLGASKFRSSAIEGPRNHVSKPNFIVIVLDDADSGMFTEESLRDLFPNIGRIAKEGIRFTNCHASTPLCAPSRASFLRGQYAHRTGVRVNDPVTLFANGFSGSYSEYKRLGFDKDDLSVWLKDLGYRTMLVGKYLHNNYDFKVPVGWDDFYYSLGNKYFDTKRFTTATVPAGSSSHLMPEQYRNTVEADDAVRLIESCNADGKQPFFLYLTPLAPHDPENKDKWIDQNYHDVWSELRLPATPDLNEADVSDKSRNIAQMLRMNSQEVLETQHFYQQRMRSVKSVDDMVGRIYSTLEEADQLENTYIFFTSDHGFLIGQHRLIGKCMPYTASTSVPLFVRGPGVAQGASANHLIAHFDVGPTLVELAGGKSPSFVDGKSFAQLLAAPEDHAEVNWREPILIEHWESMKSRRNPLVPVFSALRMHDKLFVEWADGDSEYYDLIADPLELENRFESLDPRQKVVFQSKMKKIKNHHCDPIATVVSPNYTTPPQIGGEGEITGMAEDDGGVAQVNIVIRDPKTSLFWNGESWQTESNRVSAQLDRPQGLLTSWRYHPKMNHSRVDVRSFEVSAIAVDIEGNESAYSAAMEVQVDAMRPATKLIRPANNFDFVGQVRIVGTTNDNCGVAQVQLTLRDMTSRLYWNGTNWSASQCMISLTLAPKTSRWHYFPPLSKGRYCVWARAVDQVGNVESSPASAVFTLR